MSASTAERVLTLRCQRTLAGPFTAGAALLRLVVPDLVKAGSPVPAAQSLVVHALAPDLAKLLPPPPGTLTTSAPDGERTRYFSAARPRFLAHGVAALLHAWAISDSRGVSVVLEGIEQADPTDLALLDVLQRTLSPAVRIESREVPATVAPDAQAFVEADGTALAPPDYLALDPAERARRHTIRAELLVGVAGADMGAIPYHLERGADPSGAGADALRRLLERCFNSGFYDAAVDAARRGLAVVHREQRPELHSRFALRLVNALSTLGRVEEALDGVHQLRRQSIDADDHLQCAYALAMLLTRQPGNAQPLEALAWANVGIALADTYPDPSRRAFHRAFMRNARALVELHLGQLEQASSLVEEAIALTDEHLGPTDHLLHRTVLIHNRGRVALLRGDVAQALEDFSLVVERDPGFEDAVFDRARAHTAAGDLVSAVQDYSRAVELRDTFVEAFFNRAVALLQLGEDGAALADLGAVLALDPDHLPALTTRAELLLQSAQLDRAEADIRRGIDLAPTSTDLLCALGLLHQERQQAPEARSCYNQALAEDPQCVEALGNRAILSYTEHRLPEAIADLDRALAVQPSPELYLNRGIAAQTLERHEAAVADFDQALDRGADRAECWFRRGLSRLALGDAEGGREDWTAHLGCLAGGGEESPHAEEIAAELRQPAPHAAVSGSW